MRFGAALLALALALAWPRPAGGQEEPGVAAAKSETAFERQPAFGRGEAAGLPLERRASPDLPVGGFVLWAVVVLLALVGALSVLRKIARDRRWLGASEAIQVVGRRALGTHQQIVLIEVGSRILRVGLTKDSMVYLGETIDPEEVAAIKAKGQSAREDSSAVSFQRAMQAASTEAPTDPEATPDRLGEVKRELASIRRAVQGWMS